CISGGEEQRRRSLQDLLGFFHGVNGGAPDQELRTASASVRPRRAFRVRPRRKMASPASSIRLPSIAIIVANPMPDPKRNPAKSGPMTPPTRPIANAHPEP